MSDRTPSPTPEAGQDERQVTAYEPHRDYRFEYAGDAIRNIEENTCRLGCWRAGTEADIAEHGPGGTCVLLANLFFLTEPQPEIEDHGDDGLRCNARQNRDISPNQFTLPIEVAS